MGRNMTASATTYSVNPRYCKTGEVSDRAHELANQLTPMNATSTINHDILPAPNNIVPMKVSTPGKLTRNVSNAVKIRIAPARCRYVFRINIVRADASARAATGLYSNP